MAWNLSTGLVKGLLGPDAPKGSLTDLLLDGTIEIFTGSRPASADAIHTGTLLVKITLDGGTFVGGAATNGISLGVFSGTTLKQASGEKWKGTGLADGTAGWARWYSNAYDRTASATAVRADGVVSISGAEINMANGTSVITDVDSEVTDVSWDLVGS